MSLSIEQALDKIYEALKGAETDGQGSIEYSLTKIAETLETGSNVNLPAVTSDDNGDVLTVVEGNWSKADIPSQLPTVTATDNGDVLTVVEGAWAKATPSGGGGCLYVTFSTEDEGTTWTADKTFAECLEAYAYGSAVIARWNYEGTLGIANLSGFDGLGTVGSPISEMYFKYLTYFTNAIAGYNFKVFSFVLTNEDAVRYRADEFTIISASQ